MKQVLTHSPYLTHSPTHSLTHSGQAMYRWEIVSMNDYYSKPQQAVIKECRVIRSRYGTHSLTHSLTHLLTYSLTHSLTYSLSHSLTYLLTHSLTHSLTHLLTYLLTHLLTQVVLLVLVIESWIV